MKQERSEEDARINAEQIAILERELAAMQRTPEEQIIHKAKNDAAALISEQELKALEIKQSAERYAKSKLDQAAHDADSGIVMAAETARQMLLKTNLDITQIHRICDDVTIMKGHIVEIKERQSDNHNMVNIIALKQDWMQRVLTYICLGIGGIFFTLLGNLLVAHLGTK